MSEKKGFNSYAATMTRIKRLRKTWQNMNYRCYGERNSKRTQRCYKDKGVEVCEEWRISFEAFYDWAVENGYDDGLTIDRIDPDGNYCPENCCWITHAENARKAASKSERLVETAFFRQRQAIGVPLTTVAKHIGVSVSTVSQWENGAFFPSAEKLPKIAAYYGCTVDELLDGNPARRESRK